MTVVAAAILEATGEIEEALIAFERADKLGIERAKVNIRNVSTIVTSISA